MPDLRFPAPPAAPLRGCPFCGAAPAWERHPTLRDAVRLACPADACGVRPRTEFLLVAYADELVEAWNARSPAAGNGAGLREGAAEAALSG